MHKECFPERGWKVLRNVKGVFSPYRAILAGGTALAIQIGHRTSVDLDFFTPEALKIEPLISRIRKTARSFRILSEGEEHLTSEIEGIKVSLFRYEYPFLQKPLLLEGVRIAGLLDIAAMKVIAINQRGTKRDFIDLYFILQTVPFHTIAEHMVKRFGKERISPVHIGKSLVYFSDAESNPEPDFLMGKAVRWEAVKKFFRQHVRQIVLDLDSAVKDASESMG
jgi:predicted nucleotidyltransferase component of viral defense system